MESAANDCIMRQRPVPSSGRGPLVMLQGHVHKRATRRGSSTFVKHVESEVANYLNLLEPDIQRQIQLKEQAN